MWALINHMATFTSDSPVFFILCNKLSWPYGHAVMILWTRTEGDSQVGRNCGKVYGVESKQTSR